jgi:hypothetical protein
VKEEVVEAPEAVAVEAGAVAAEPEVIKKGKQETAEEGCREPEGREAERRKKRSEPKRFTTLRSQRQLRLRLACGNKMGLDFL